MARTLKGFYSVDDSIDLYGMESTTENWSKTKKILGDRISWMYIHEGDKNAEKCLVGVLVDSQSTLGIEVATTLKMLIPACEKGKCGKDIFVNAYPDVNLLQKHIGDLANAFKSEEGNQDAVTSQRTHAVCERFDVCAMEDRYYVCVIICSIDKIELNIYEK